ncbi:hypothetical protein [Hyphomonas chukchiensis]|nr:hypothetical protein [Hyphomonas chukchiensis]
MAFSGSRLVLAGLVGAMALCAACSGSASPETDGTAEAAQGKKVAGGEADRLLGAVNLPKPDWLPKGFPLPGDAHIYSVTKPNVTPAAYQLQARTLADGDKLFADMIRWGEDQGISVTDALAGREVGATRVLEVSGGGWAGVSSIQIQDDASGYRRIVLSLQKAE